MTDCQSFENSGLPGAAMLFGVPIVGQMMSNCASTVLVCPDLCLETRLFVLQQRCRCRTIPTGLRVRVWNQFGDERGFLK
jgi:hypothetical protein